MIINSYNLEFSKEAEKDYMKLSLKDKGNVIKKIIETYKSGAIRMIAPLKDNKLLKRIKSGNFRVVIFTKTKINHKIIIVGDRKEVYNRIKRKGSHYMY